MSNFLKENKVSIPIYCIILSSIILLLPSLGVLIAFGIVIVIIVLNRKGPILKSIGFVSQKNWLKTILISLALGVLIELSFQLFFNHLFEYVTSSKIDVSGFDNVRGNFIPFIIMLIIGWVVGGFIEEITFRGYLITRLIKVFGDNQIVLFLILLIVSAIFGLAHLYQGWAGVLSTGTIAFIFGLVFIKSKFNIWYPVLTHGFVNTVGFTLIYLDIDIIIQNIWL